MAGEDGSAVLLKLGSQDTPPTFTTVAGLRSTRIAITGDAVAVTNAASGGWRELLSGAGVRSVRVSANGIFTGRAAESAIRDLALGGQVAPYMLTFDGGNALRADLLITALDYAGDREGERAYHIELESSGPVAAA